MILKLLLLLSMMLGLSGLAASAPLVQAKAPDFSLQTITLADLPIYDLKVAPQRGIAALYTGATATAVLGFPVAEYTVEESLTPIRLIDLNTGAELVRLQGAQDYVADLAFSPAEDLLAAYYRNGDVYLWNLDDFSLQNQFMALWGGTSIAFLPDGQHIVSQLREPSQFLVWDVTSGQATQVWRTPLDNFGQIVVSDPLARLDYWYNAFALSSQGVLATVTPNGELLTWETPSLEQTIVRTKDEGDALGRFNIRHLSFSADGKTLVYFDKVTESTHLWDMDSQTERARLPLGDAFVALSDDGQRLAWRTREEGVDVIIHDLNQPDTPLQIAFDLPKDARFNPISPLFFLPDGRLVVGGVFNNSGAGGSALYIISFP